MLDQILGIRGNPLSWSPVPSVVQPLPLSQVPEPAPVASQQPTESQFWPQLEAVMREAHQADTDPWAAAYAKRFNPQTAEMMGLEFVGKEDDPMRDIEHFLYARDTARTGPLGFAQMALGTPAHAAKKWLTGQSDTSAEEIVRGWQGAGVGMREWLENLYSGGQ